MSEDIKIQNCSYRPFYFPIKPVKDKDGGVTGAWNQFVIPAGSIGVIDVDNFNQNLRNHRFFKKYCDTGDLKVLNWETVNSSQGPDENKYFAFRTFVLNFQASYDANSPQWAGTVDENGMPTIEVIRMNLPNLDAATIKLFVERFLVEKNDGLFEKTIVLPSARNRVGVEAKVKGKKVDVKSVDIIADVPEQKAEEEMGTTSEKDEAPEAKEETSTDDFANMTMEDLLTLADSCGLVFEKKPTRKTLIKLLSENK